MAIDPMAKIFVVIPLKISINAQFLFQQCPKILITNLSNQKISVTKLGK
jgi:hypothetical protein